jgi:hypothetical protein
MNFSGLIAFAILITAALFPQTAPKTEPDVQTQWQAIDQLCGQLELAAPKKKQIVVDGKAESHSYTVYLEGATVSLYPATLPQKECCDAMPMATVRSSNFGRFEFEGVQHGTYCLRIQKNELIFRVPVRITKDFDQKACHDPSVGRSVVVDSSPPKIETRIR